MTRIWFDSAPFVVGANTTSKLQLPFTCRVVVQLLFCTVKSPVVCGATLEMVTGPVLVFVSVTKLLLLKLLKFTEVPMAKVPKLSGGVGATPKPPVTTFPVSDTVLDVATLLPRLAVTNRRAVYVPTVAGALKDIATVQVLPGPGAAGTTKPVVPGIQVVPVDAIEKFEELVPVRETTPRVNGPVPVFVTVTV